jgi:glycosyltransferase involved in cell wall biosynthesis
VRVAFFLPRLGDGGVFRSTLPLAAEFVRHGHAVDLLTVRGSAAVLAALPEGVRRVELGGGRTLTAIPQLARYLRRERPGALISAQHYANVAALLAARMARTGTSVIVTERLAITEALAYDPPLKRQVLSWLMRRTYPWARAVVANSAAGATGLATFLGWRPEQVHAILNPTYDERMRAAAADARTGPPPHPWLAAGEPPVVVAVGRLTPQKDFASLLRAFAQARSRTPARLLIVGEGPERPVLEALITRLGIGEDVALVGHLADPYPFIARARVLALSSRYEGLPNVVIEAQALGVPVIATDCPTGPRELLEDGLAGVLVPVADERALGDGIAGLLLDPARADALAQRAREQLERFTPERAYARYARLVGLPAPEPTSP